MSGSANRSVWIVLAAVVAALGLAGVYLGVSLVPPREIAAERGTVAGWWIIWTVIGLSTLMALSIAGFLVAAGLGKVPETRG